MPWLLVPPLVDPGRNQAVMATNTHLRLLTRGAYGYRPHKALIARAMLTRSGLEIVLPGRAA